MVLRRQYSAGNIPIDTQTLRRVLRLVHCLQKERGASCAYLAANNRHRTVSSALLPARKHTDQALRGMDASLQRTLGKIRNMMKDESSGFHKLLLCYNTLIQNIVHEYILRFTSFQRHLQRASSNESDDGPAAVLENGRDVGSTGGDDPVTLKKSHHRVRSVDFLFRDKETQPIGTHNSFHSGDIFSMFLLPHAITKQQSDRCADTFVSGKPLHDGSKTFKCTETQHRQFDTDEECTGSDAAQFESSPNSTICRLVDLLDVFVRLKESTGVERATLSSILAAGRRESAVLLSDLVLEVENQRRHLNDLRSLPAGPLHNLVQEVVTMGPEMQALQSDILNGGDLQDFDTRYSSHELWDMLSLYINKLHSLELLLVEEIEAEGAAPVEGTVLTMAFGEGDVLPVVEALPPDEVKERLMAALAQQPLEDQKQLPAEPTKEPKSSVDELLSELTKAPASKEWEIDLYEVQFLKRIGQGAAGTTYLAKWSGLEVAVKVASISEMGLEGWRKEVQNLQKLHHPNIIRLLGSVYHPNPLTFCLVLEYCNAGDLVQALKRPTPANFFFHVASSISKGMTYLHHRGTIHRDIKPGNVLLDGKVSTGIFSCKLADFGVATDSKNMDEDKTAETGTYRWMSPEVIRHEKYTQTADVFSYGVLLWQLLTREVPFADVGQIEAAAAVALEDRRCPIPVGTPEGIRDLIEQCWASAAEKRPAFQSVTDQLRELENSLTLEEQEWLAAPIGHRVYEELPGNEVKNKPAKMLDARKIEMEEKKKMLKEGKKQRAGFKRMFLKRRSFHF